MGKAGSDEPVDAPDLVQSISLVLWTLKDFGWVLLLAPLALPAGFAALLVVLWALARSWCSAGAGVCVHMLAEMSWLSGNCVWMCAEFFYAPAGKSQFPWYRGPLVANDQLTFRSYAPVCQGIWVAGLVTLVCYYVAAATCKRRRAGTEQAAAKPVFGIMSLRLYSCIYTGPWMCKELFWINRYGWSTQLCGAIVLLIVLDCLRRHFTLTNVAMVFWIAGSLTWSYAELFQEDETPGRSGAAAIFCCSVLAASADLAQAYFREQAGERTPFATALPPYEAAS